MGTKVSPNNEQAQILRRTLAILYAEQLAACPNEYLLLPFFGAGNRCLSK